MAIVFEELSQCPLCQQVLNQSREYILIPPLTSNTMDPLFIFSDNGVHTHCLNEHPLQEHLFYITQQYDKMISHKICVVDGKLIDNPRDWLSIGMLASDQNEPLAGFNFINLNRNNKYNWTRRNEFISLAEEFSRSEKWKSYGTFNYLGYLIKELK